jgi:hypothetical protein
VVDLGGNDTVGADIATLAARAALLASVVTSSPMKDEVASRAGVSPDQLIAIPPATSEPVPGSGGGSAQPTAKALDKPGVYVLKAVVPTLDTGQVPIISVKTQAPTEAAAARLANESIKVLQQHLASVASTDKVPDERRITVRQLGPARSELEVRGPGAMIAIIAVLGLFGFGCATILGIQALIGGWRQASELERNPPAPSDADEYFEVEPQPLPVRPVVAQAARRRSTAKPKKVPPPEPEQPEHSTHWASR